MRWSVRAGHDSLRVLVQLFTTHTIKIRLEIPAPYLFYILFWQLSWQPSSSCRSQIICCFLLLFVLFFFFFKAKFSFTSCCSRPTFFFYSVICQVFFMWTRAQKQKELLVSFHPLSVFLSSNPLLLNRSSALLRYFRLNQSSGVLTVRQNTPAGSYWLRVGVSDGVWPDVISGVRVHVRDLEEKAILSSASLRLTGNFDRNTDSPDGMNTC